MDASVTERGINRSAAGFTLLEILVAVTILGMAYLVVLQNFSLSLRNIERIERSGRRNYETMLTREHDFLVIPGQLEAEPLVGKIYVQGRQYQLVQVDSAVSPGLTTLVLERLP